MPEVEVNVGGRAFRVACQEGEEHFLRAASAMLSAEAEALQTQLGRLPETRMLLMAGLMLADRTAAVEDELRSLKSRLAEVEARAAGPGDGPALPQGLVEQLAELATRAETMAARIEGRA